MPPTPKAPTPTIGAVEPPPRKRKRKVTLSDDVLSALQAALSTSTWTGNGIDYDGDDGAKNATTAARIYRRDLARAMSISDRKIRTRVWETEPESGVWRFGLQLRDDNGNS